MIIQPATGADVAEVVTIEAEAFSDPWSPDAFDVMVGRPHVAFDVVRDDAAGPVLGYVVAIFAGGEGEVANLAVSPEVRRRGIGRALVSATLDEARRRKAEAVFLEVREGNSAARRLYRSCGFDEVGRRRGYYTRPTEDALILKKPLEHDPA